MEVDTGHHAGAFDQVPLLGGGGRDGDIALFRSDATISQTDFSDATVHLDANGGNLWMGGKGADGDVVLFPSDATEINDTSQASVWLNGQDGNLMLGGAGHDGDIALFPSDATISQSSFSEATIHLDGRSIPFGDLATTTFGGEDRPTIVSSRTDDSRLEVEA